VIALLNNALGRAARTSDLSPAKMLDLDAVPEDAASLTETLAYLGSDKADAIRGILVNEIVVASDLVLRNSTRKLASSLQGAFGIDLPLPSIPFLPRPRIPLPNLFALLPETLRDQALDRVAPALSSEEDVYAGDLGELCKSLLGFDIQDLIVGLASPQKVAALVGPVIMSAMRQPSNSRSSAKYAGFAAQSSPKAGAASETSESLTREFLDLLPFPNVFSRGGSISSAGGSSSGDATRQQARASLEAIGLEVFGQLRKLQEERLGLGSAATEN
jgi:hypothetical protein